MRTSVILRSALAAGLFGGASLAASAQGLETEKARPFNPPTLAQAAKAAAGMKDAPSAKEPAPAKWDAAHFDEYLGDYKLFRLSCNPPNTDAWKPSGSSFPAATCRLRAGSGRNSPIFPSST